MNRIRPRALIFAAAVATLAGCGAHVPVAVTTPAPTPAQQLEARRLGDAVVVTATAALQSLDALGPVIEAAPLSTAQKDAYDCALLRVIGTPRGGAPPFGGRVQQICGTLPTTETAPLRQALDAVHQVTSCASLRTSVTALLAAVTPLFDRLSASGNQVLVFAGASLRASLAFAQSVITGGTPCSD